MSDITYQDLIKARSNQPDGDDNLIGMANVALKILEQVNMLKAGGATNVMSSRSPQMQTQSQKPKGISVTDISEALSMVKQLKGDIKISELEKLLKEHGDQINGLLEKRT